MLNTQIYEREAYRAMFSFGGTVANLDPSQVTNISAAAENARAFATEVVSLLKNEQPTTEHVTEAPTQTVAEEVV